MKTISRILAYEGLALVAFGLLGIVFASEVIFFALAMLATGVICLGAFLVLGGVSLKDRMLSRGTKYGTNAVLYSVAILGVVVAINYLAARHEHEWDMTGAKVNTLAGQTVKVLGSLESPVKVTAFMKAGEQIEIEPLLERYGRASDRFEFEIIDPDLHPEIVARYEVTRRGDIVVETGERNTIITGQTEQDLTNAIVKVSKAQQGAVYFLTGHGELGLDSKEERGLYAIKGGLENENYIVRPLLLETESSVPADCKALVIAGPSKPLSDRVIDEIDKYLAGGGRALIMLDPQTKTGLATLTAKYGIVVNDDVIVDQQLRLFEGATLGLDPVVSDFPAHEITDKFDQAVVFAQARSLTTADSARELARTGDTSWGESDLAKLFDSGEVGLDDQDVSGPLAVAAVVEKDLDDGNSKEGETDITRKNQTRLVVVGDSDFASNQYVNYMYNGILFFNTIHWLSGEEYLVAIPPKSYAPTQVNLTSKDRQIVFFASVFLVPQIILMLGIGAILRRRSR
jgi:gliding motility-associatede transport system auxiliary component